MGVNQKKQKPNELDYQRPFGHDLGNIIIIFGNYHGTLNCDN